MKNRILLVFLTMVLVVSLVAFAACAKEEEEEVPPVTEEWQWPRELMILSLSSGSAAYARDMGYGILLERDTEMKVRVAAEDNFVLRYTWMKDGRFFWTTFEHLHMISMLEGKGEFASRTAGPWQMRIAYSSAAPNFIGFAVRGDSDIKTPHDIKPGTKVGFLTTAPGVKEMVEAMLTWAQIDPEDVTWVPASTFVMAVVHLMDGRADVIIHSPGVTWWSEAEASPYGVAWMELNSTEDPEGARRFLQKVPFVSMAACDMPGMTPSAAGVHMLSDIGIKAVRADADPELVSRIVKWCDENYDRFKDAHPTLPGMSLEMLLTVIGTSFVPVHEGTIRYLKEKGLWTDAHEVRNQANVELMTRWCEAYETAIGMADEKGISVSPRNEEWIDLWENYKKELGLPRFMVFPGLD